MRKIMLLIILILIATNGLTFVLMGDNKGKSSIQSLEFVDIEKPVATIQDEAISYHDWLDYLGENFGEEGLEEMINRQVIRELADQEKLTVNPAVIDLEMAFLATLTRQLSEDQVIAAEKKWHETIESRLLMELLFTRDITVTDGEIQSYYDMYQSQYQFSHRIELSHIVLADEGTAERVYQELEDGADFQTLAYEYSIDEESKVDGGYLGFFTKESNFLLAGYFEQTSELKPYNYTQPFLSDQGYVLVYLHRELPEIDLAYDELKDYIKVKLALEKSGETPAIQELWKELDVDWIY